MKIIRNPKKNMFIYHACSAASQSICFRRNSGPLALLLPLLPDFLLRSTVHIVPQISQQFYVSKSTAGPRRRVNLNIRERSFQAVHLCQYLTRYTLQFVYIVAQIVIFSLGYTQSIPGKEWSVIFESTVS